MSETKDLIIHSNAKGVEIALLENKRLVEYHTENDSKAYSTGDIYLGRVKKLNPGLNAAFLDVGHARDAFIHYTDLGPNLLSFKQFCKKAIHANQEHLLGDFELEKEIIKTGKINDVLKKGDYLIVQVLKESISTKGPRMTAEITIPGRHVVLAPMSNAVGISKKLRDRAERKRLTNIIESIRPKNFGVVVRTNAKGKGTADLHKDIDNLVKKWEKMTENLHNSHPPKLLLSELDKSLSLLRDMLNSSFSRIAISDIDLYNDVKAYLERVAPKMASLVHLHKSKKPIFEAYDVSRQIKSAFGRTYTLRSGAYLVIEHTEAMHVVDINSGPKIKMVNDQDLNAFNVNVESAREIARQMRLRDMGGIIIIDFIDMKSAEYRSKILAEMQEAMKNDSSKHSILPLTKFGLMQITRQRSRPEVNIDTTEVNPDNDDRIESSILLADKIDQEVRKYIVEGQKNLMIHAHPFLEAYIKKGFKSMQRKWMYLAKSRIKVYGDSSLGLMEYVIYDSDNKPLNL